MLFSTILAAGLAQAMTASAATMMVTVAANNKFQFTPNSVTAQPGDMVAFNFVAQNHSVASSTANNPCQPEQNAIFSDFQPIPGNPNGSPNGGNGGGNGKNRNNNRQAGNTPMFMVPITDTDPIYIYCSQAQHCQQGMVMVINPPNGNAVTQYQNKAAQANNNISPRGGMSGGSIINNKAGTNPKNVLGAKAGDAAATANTKKNGGKKNGGKKNGGKKNGGGNAGDAAAGLAALLGGGKGN